MLYNLCNLDTELINIQISKKFFMCRVFHFLLIKIYFFNLNPFNLSISPPSEEEIVVDVSVVMVSPPPSFFTLFVIFLTFFTVDMFTTDKVRTLSAHGGIPAAHGPRRVCTRFPFLKVYTKLSLLQGVVFPSIIQKLKI